MPGIGNLDPTIPTGTGVNGKVSDGDDRIRETRQALSLSFANWDLNPGTSDILAATADEIDAAIDLIDGTTPTFLPLAGGALTGPLTGPLTLDGSVVASAPSLVMSTNAGTGLYDAPVTTGVSFAANAVEVMRFIEFVINTYVPLRADLSVGSNSNAQFSFEGASDMGMWSGDGATLNLSVGGRTAIAITKDGVGFGADLIDFKAQMTAVGQVFITDNLKADNETRLAALEARVAVLEGFHP